MAKLSYVDTIVDNEGVQLAFDQIRIVEAGQVLVGVVQWFEMTTGRKLFATGAAAETPVEQPEEYEEPKTADAPPKKVRRKRRTKAEMAAEAKPNGEDPFQDAEPQENPVIATITGDAPTPDDLRMAAENFLGNAGPEGPDDFKALLAAYDAKKISGLDAKGRTAVMAKLMETPADG